MREALELGRRAMGNAWPNPAVGCVIVQGDRVVGRGWTRPGGRPHAEAVALAEAGGAAEGATAYVTLEPCSHHGETPPCAEALIRAGVARVVVPIPDSDPRVSGKGLAMLRAAGVEVVEGVLSEEAARDHAGFFLRLTEGRPLLTLKLATSLDGRIATATGESRWITGPEARARVQGMRACHDAVMVGAGTARADDPQLTVRDREVPRQPVRVVVSRRLDVPLMSQLARTAREVPVWMCHDPGADAALCQAWEGLGATLLPARLRGQHMDMASVLRSLGDQGLTRVLCEGGGALAASLLQAGLVDELVCFTAGMVIGAEGTPAIGALGLERLGAAPRFQLVSAEAVGGDIMHRWERVRV
ncbi:bifunctional diaminohydroxyphosphoribosylaminopyrimidine deaminase/5-amino-6-(5-phosphoribosylamino)uracil reductase RibD [Roseovarius sp. SCSIO 43702]|nr:bifunctional diaminohydroxyphosphoribosylaminopyrimidine deaminase/5-amino-6-(5-phosphoribosylamino)uracil reductase RibD [Roseovarius sp. SCSIO 43702]QYX58631.1 bifunctional diaminohydroxyphosphoribosylaminopyrimidine deaminase/5-amino-6-(5-phosphoribosylamino)uracil reductase RibD [Roseovarius sp. SCSIO 43702]